MNLSSYQKLVKETLLLAIPVIIGQLGQMLMGVIDTIMIGKLGHEYVSAAGLGHNVFILLAIIGIGMTSVLAPLIAESAAKSDAEGCRNYLQQAVYVSLIVGVMITVALLIISYQLPLLQQPKMDTVLAQGFLQIFAISVVPMLIFLTFKQFADGLSDTRPAAIITFIGLVCNVLLNYLFIKGNLGFPRWELNGSALASLISRLLMMVLMIGYVFNNKAFEPYQLREKWGVWKANIAKKVLKMGMSAGLQYWFEVGAFGGAVIMIGWLGETDAESQIYRAAHQIVINIASLTYMVSLGFSSAGAILVGDALGRNDKENIKQSGYIALALTLVWMSITAFAFVIGNRFFPSLYNIEKVEVLDTASRLMLIAALFQLFDGAQCTALGILRGLQDLRFPTLITFFAYWVASLPFAYLLGFYYHLKVDGIWYSFVIGLGIAAIANTFRFWYLTRT